MHREVRRLLADDAADLPVTTVDIRRVVRRAKQIRRRRRIVGTSATLTVLVALVLVVSTGALRPHHYASVAAVPAGSATPMSAPVRFDPLVRTLSVGWKPAGLLAGRVEITPYRQTYSAPLAAPSGQEAAGSGLVVSMLTAGQGYANEVDPALPRVLSSRPTSPVAGRAADCLVVSAAGGCSGLRWEYAPGAYAVATFRDTQVTDTEEVVRRVAGSVSLTGDVPLTAPFAFTGGAATRSPVRSVVEPADQPNQEKPWSVSLTVADPADPDDTEQVTAARPTLATAAMARDTTNTTVDGHPATLRQQPAEITVYEVRGVAVTLTLHGTGVADPREAYQDLRVTDLPTDPTRWTVPIRPANQPR